MGRNEQESTSLEESVIAAECLKKVFGKIPSRQWLRNNGYVYVAHVHYWTLRGSALFRRSLNYLVDVLDVNIKSGGRGADALRTSPSHRHILWTKHQSCAAQCQFCVHRLTIGAVHGIARTVTLERIKNQGR